MLSETSSQFPIDVYGGCVPVEHFPSHSVAFLCEGDLCEVNHEGFADPLASELWPDKEIFQENSLPPLPGGVMVEEEGHTGRLAIRLANNHPELAIRCEAILDQCVFFSSNRTTFPPRF